MRAWKKSIMHIEKEYEYDLCGTKALYAKQVVVYIVHMLLLPHL